MIQFSDEELMLHYCEGSKEAYHQLYSRYSSRVYGFIRKRISDAALADEVFQEVFFKLHRSRSQYDPNHKLAPWLFVICRSVVTDHLRQRTRSREHAVADIGELADMAFVEGPEPLQPRLEVSDEAATVRQKLSGLPTRSQEVLKMRYEDDLDFDEIAKRLGLKQENVRQILSRSIRQLKGQLGGKQSHGKGKP